MALASLSLSPVEPVFSTLSLPARSTTCIRLVNSFITKGTAADFCPREEEEEEDAALPGLEKGTGGTTDTRER